MIVKKAFNKLKCGQKSVFFAHTNCTVRFIKNFYAENILRVPKRSSLHQTVDQQPLKQTTETAVGPRFAVEVLIYRKNICLSRQRCLEGYKGEKES